MSDQIYCIGEFEFMPRTLVALLIASVFTVFVPQAFADWSETTWKMTPAEVLQCEDGAIEPTDDEYHYGIFTGITPFGVIKAKRIGAFDYDVIFGQDSAGKFNSIIFISSYDAFRDARRGLITKFGPADLEEGGLVPSAQWTDRPGNNVVEISVIASTIIQYQPIPTGGF